MSDHKVPPGYTFKGESPDGTIVATQPLTNHETQRVIGYNNVIVDSGGKILKTFQTWLFPEGGSATGLPKKSTPSSSQSDTDKQRAEQLAIEKEKERKEREQREKDAGGAGSGGGSGTGTGSSGGQSDSTPSLKRGDHSHTVHGAVDTSANWKTIKSDGNEIVTRNDETHTTMTHMRDGTIFEQVDGKSAYKISGPVGSSSDSSNSLNFVSENGSLANPKNTPPAGTNYASEHGVNMGFLTDNTDHSGNNSSHPQSPPAYTDAKDRTPDAISLALEKPTNTWHANPSWEAPNADNKSAISQIAPSIDTNNVLEVRLGDHNNYLLRMNDGTYQSIDLNSGNVSGAGTWNKSQWTDSGYGTSNASNDTAPGVAPSPAPVPAPDPGPQSSATDDDEATNLTRQWAQQHPHHENSSSGSSNSLANAREQRLEETINAVATPSPSPTTVTPTPAGQSAQELLYGFDNSSTSVTGSAPTTTSSQSQGATLADQFSGHVDTAAIDKSLRDMGIVPAAPAPAQSAPDTSDVVSRYMANQSAQSDSQPFTLPGATKQADQFAVSLDPPSSGPSLMERHFKAGRDIE